MATRTVQGTLKKANGEAITGDITFLIKSGFTDSGTMVIGQETVKTDVASDGTFSIVLESGASVTYLCILPTLERFEFSLPDSVDPLDIVDVR